MKIAIDIRSTLKRKTGIGYYTINLINNLALLDKKNRYYLYSKINLFSRNKKLPTLPGKNFKHFVNRLRLSHDFLLRNFNILHTSSYDLPKSKKGKLVLVVHDLIHRAYPDGLEKSTIETVEENLKKVLPATDKIITVSDNTKKDLIRYYSYPEENITTIYPGIDVDILHMDKGKMPNFRYILFVGTLEPRKNIKGLIEAFNILRHNYNIEQKLIIAGMKGWMYEDIFETVRRLKLENNIVFTGYADRRALKNLYSYADALVYPSFYEGFGFPIIEAFSCGIPVITSNTSSCAELGEGSALLVDPKNIDALSSAMFRALTDDTLRQQMIEDSKEKVKMFSWHETAWKTLEVFKQIAS